MVVVAQVCDCKVSVVGSIPTRVNELLFIHIFIFSFGKKPGVEFRHSTRNSSKNSAKSGERSVLPLGSLCLLS